MCKQRPETNRHRLCCGKLGTSHDVKGFAIGSFLEGIVVERAKMTFVRKTFKTLALSARIDRFVAKFALKITTKLAVFYQLLFGEICLENSHKIGRFFHKFVPETPVKFDIFSMTYQKPCYVE